MESNKKELHIITNQPYILQETIDWYNNTFKTDFVFDRFVEDEVNYAFVTYEKATNFHIFQLGANYGRKCEAFDKRITDFLPPDYFADETKYPKEF